MMMKLLRFPILAFLVPLALLPLTSCLAQDSTAGATTPVQPIPLEAGQPFSSLPLVDEVICGAEGDKHEFAESSPGVSKVATLLGQPCRTLPNEGDARYFAYRLGAGKGLEAGASYLLTVEFPEDVSRSMFIANRGCETSLGIRTGSALGDALYTFTNNNSESIKIPLSGKYRTWKSLFHLHDRLAGLALPRGKELREGLPADGMWVIVTQSKADNDPISAGAAVSRIRLFAVPDRTRFNLALKMPPAGLPRRHIFWREEMGDGVINSPVEAERGVSNTTDWFEYKAHLMQFLGINTFTKDLLEFGSNQGWDSGPTNEWYFRSKQPEMWPNILTMLRKYDFSVLPYYEYAGGTGSKGLGSLKRAQPLSSGATYTHITWSEKRNIDVTDPEALADAEHVLDATLLRYKDQTQFVGAWFRPRVSAMPIGFGDATRQRFANDVRAGAPVSREDLKADKTLLKSYYGWWFTKRRDFLTGLRDHLRAGGIKDAVILFTSDASEPGRSLPGKKAIVTDDSATWEKLLAEPQHASVRALDMKEVITTDAEMTALISPRRTFGKWEWQHADPQADPQHYRDVDGVLLTHSYDRAYTVSSPESMEAFRTPSGLAAVHHKPLNENVMDKSLGYFVGDMENSGPYCMLSEARAIANGDPDYLGYLASSNFNRGFPEYVRAFDAAYLALPALPSVVLPGVASDPEVVVRSIATQADGTYLAVVNTGLAAKQVTLTLPVKGKITDASTGNVLTATNGTLQMELYPCQLRSLRVQ